MAMRGKLSAGQGASKPVLLVLTSTYPRWANDPEPGFVHELAKRLTDQFRVIVLCPHAPGAKGRELLDGVRVVRYRYAPEKMETLVTEGGIVANLRRSWWKYGLVPGFLLAQAWYGWRLVRKNRVDVIHAHWLIPQGVIAALLKRLSHGEVRSVVTSHGSDVNMFRGFVMGRIKRWVIHTADAVTGVSELVRKKLEGIGGHGTSARIAPMGVDLRERFTPADISRDKKEILFVGRLVHGKGVDKSIKAMRRVLARYPDAQLTVVGSGSKHADLKQLASKLGVENSVSFVGPVSQNLLPQFYQRASVLVAPFGKNEGFGLVLVEAIGCGCPIITNDTSSARYILGESVNVSVVDCDDIANLADRIISVLGDPEAAKRRADQLRSHVLQRFDWTHSASNYEEVLREAIVAPS